MIFICILKITSRDWNKISKFFPTCIFHPRKPEPNEIVEKHSIMINDVISSRWYMAGEKATSILLLSPLLDELL